MSHKVDYRETLVTYLNSEDIATAAHTLNITKATLIGRLQAMKKAGVKVPNKGRKRGLTSLEIAQLNSLINKYKKGL